MENLMWMTQQQQQLTALERQCQTRISSSTGAIMVTSSSFINKLDDSKTSVSNDLSIVSNGSCNSDQQQDQRQQTRKGSSKGFGNDNQMNFNNAQNEVKEVISGLSPEEIIKAECSSLLNSNEASHDEQPPKRPMSAYNLFFHLERRRLLDGEPERIFTTEDVAEFALQQRQNANLPKPKRPHRKTHGKIGFTDLARAIGNRWKQLDDDAKNVFHGYYEIEMARFKKEYETWNERQTKLKEAEKVKKAAGEIVENILEKWSGRGRLFNVPTQLYQTDSTDSVTSAQEQARTMIISNNVNIAKDRMKPGFNRRLMNPAMATQQGFNGPVSADSIPDTVSINALDQSRKGASRVVQGMKAPIGFMRGGTPKSNRILAQQQHFQAMRLNQMKEMRLRRQQQEYMMEGMDRFPLDAFAPQDQYNMMMMGLTPDEQAQLLALEEEQAQRELMMLSQQSGGYGGHFPEMETATLYEQQLVEAAAAGDPYAAELLAEDVPYYMADQTFDFAWQTLMPFGGSPTGTSFDNRPFYPDDQAQLEQSSVQPHGMRMNTSYQTHDSFYHCSSHSPNLLAQRQRKQMQQRMMMQQLQKQHGVRNAVDESVNSEMKCRTQQQAFGYNAGANARNSKIMLMAKLQEQEQLKRYARNTSMSNVSMNQSGRTSVTNECPPSGIVDATTPHQYKHLLQQTQDDMKQDHTSNLVTPRSSDPRTGLHQGAAVDSPFSFFDDSPIAFDQEKNNSSNASDDGQCINNMFV